ncbi:MAG TPA: tRNA pseudouridine(38-40) synthase TruA, partial [Gemmataceae bacterium]|nr:tRNA pseudouridine(38-40) synthase TruA [Gemmataceae bacterium]
MRNLKLVVSYDGTDFHGWQSQPSLRTVQATLEDALAKVTQERIRVNASGRTDTGVHAVAQVVNFHTDAKLAAAVVMRALNAHLPADIVVREAVEMPETFDANRDAKRKLYRYVIHDGTIPNLFMRRYCHHARYRLDAVVMARAAACLRGTHDFRCFETEWPNRASSVRTITHLAVNRMGEWVWLDVEANGFLYNMVRAIAGTLINVGRGYWSEARVAEILTAQDRAQAGPTAPAQGLFLMRVSYERG